MVDVDQDRNEVSNETEDEFIIAEGQEFGTRKALKGFSDLKWWQCRRKK